ncbi:MAG TPA: hypothetical protein VF194_10260, partial [Ferrovibrio sp.]|uniref:hypothetical protein n=1 Tax=Ferrovibrio sp. TaxID=1917215 RepID=UPI002ED4BEA2
DATAYAVHHAVQLLSREERAIDILEMPFYRLGPAGLLTQTFTEPAGQVLEIELTPDEVSRKRCMIESYETQRAVLEMFDIAVERYRVAPKYDFTALPNQGRLFYEQQDWGMDGQRWLQLARSAQQQLRSEHPVMASLP